MSALVGQWFPTGAHKVGAAFGCLAPALVTGQFDPTTQKAVWPSTGNYCRGGAYDSALLACESIAILPEGMSQERFDWLAKVAGEMIKTPGTESNVKEIFDKCWELRQSGQDRGHLQPVRPVRQLSLALRRDRPGHGRGAARPHGSRTTATRGVVLTTGSAGTIASGDYLKQRFPGSKIGASEALQCPTLLYNGFGAHRIEGIGDKHVPWIHNIKNTDMVMGIDDDATMDLIRLFNEPAGRAYLAGRASPSPARPAAAARHLRHRQPALGHQVRQVLRTWLRQDVVMTVATDSMEMYRSRIDELRASEGQFTDDRRRRRLPSLAAGSRRLTT